MRTISYFEFKGGLQMKSEGKAKVALIIIVCLIIVICACFFVMYGMSNTIKEKDATIDALKTNANQSQAEVDRVEAESKALQEKLDAISGIIGDKGIKIDEKDIEEKIEDEAENEDKETVKGEETNSNIVSTNTIGGV